MLKFFSAPALCPLRLCGEQVSKLKSRELNRLGINSPKDLTAIQQIV
jgi:hypothetical protein